MPLIDLVENIESNNQFFFFSSLYQLRKIQVQVTLNELTKTNKITRKI